MVISNCSNNYGPYHFPEKLIPLVILNALHGKPLPVYGDGSNIRDWLYVEDHARALLTILTRGRIGEKYNVGGRNERRNIDIVRRICEILDRERPLPQAREKLITYVTDRPGHDHRYAINADKLESELGWRARNLRHRHRKDHCLVSGKRMVVAPVARKGLFGRAPRPCRGKSVMTMKLVVTGRHGQVTRALQELASPGLDVVALGRDVFDLATEGDATDIFAAARPDAIVNAGAYT